MQLGSIYTDLQINRAADPVGSVTTQLSLEEGGGGMATESQKGARKDKATSIIRQPALCGPHDRGTHKEWSVGTVTPITKGVSTGQFLVFTTCRTITLPFPSLYR